MNWAKTTTRWDKKYLSFQMGATYIRGFTLFCTKPLPEPRLSFVSRTISTHFKQMLFDIQIFHSRKLIIWNCHMQKVCLFFRPQCIGPNNDISVLWLFEVHPHLHTLIFALSVNLDTGMMLATLVWFRGTYFTKSFELLIKILQKFSLLWFRLWSSNHVTNLPMSQQLSCCDMWKIVTWSDNCFSDKQPHRFLQELD